MNLRQGITTDIDPLAFCDEQALVELGIPYELRKSDWMNRQAKKIKREAF